MTHLLDKLAFLIINTEVVVDLHLLNLVLLFICFCPQKTWNWDYPDQPTHLTFKLEIMSVINEYHLRNISTPQKFALVAKHFCEDVDKTTKRH